MSNCFGRSLTQSEFKSGQREFGMARAFILNEHAQEDWRQSFT